MSSPGFQLRISQDGTVIEERRLAPGEYLVGSASEMDIQLEANGVSRRHARLVVRPDGVLIEDLGSRFGTMVDGRPVAGLRRLVSGQSAQVGALALEVEEVEGEPVVEESRGRYFIGEVVAQGAMGAIRRTRERHTGREVAMKLMHAELGGPETPAAARFVQEARITARIEHPNIVPVHDAGRHEGGEAFYTMKMVRGTSLEKVLEELRRLSAETVRKYPLGALLTIFQKVCDAVAFAHSRSVIHRDLKPANIMLGEFGEVLVMDWGLAKDLNAFTDAAETAGAWGESVAAAGSTLAGAVLGTPHYMSPEQALGDGGSVDERSDIYALGAILYEILTLKTAQEGDSASAVLERVRIGRVMPPQRRAGRLPLPHLPGGQVPPSLEAVVLKAMSFSPERRYPRVEDLQADLAAYQQGFATSAEAAGAWRQFTLLVRRHPHEAWLLAGAVVLLAVLGALYTWRMARERDVAQAARDRATAARGAALAQRQRGEAVLAELRGTAPTFLAQAGYLTEMGRHDEAIAAAQAAVQVAPDSFAAQFLHAQLLQSAQRFAEAGPAFTRALALQPGDAVARANLALTQRLAAAGEKAPFTLLEALLAEGRMAEAVPLLLALGRDPGLLEPVIRTRLAEYRRQPGWSDDRLRRLPDGNFALNLEQLSIGDLTMLRGLPISELRLAGTGLTKVPDLHGIPLRVLNLARNAGASQRFNEITDLEPLRGLPLTSLTINALPVTDLSPLTGIPLVKLGAGNTKVSRLEPLAESPLTDLDIFGTPVQDLAPLRKCPLERLILGAYAGDLSPLRGLALRYVALNYVDVPYDLSPLLDCRTIEAIALPVKADAWCLRAHPGLKKFTITNRTATGQVEFENLSAENFWAKYGDAMKARAGDAAKTMIRPR